MKINLRIIKVIELKVTKPKTNGNGLLWLKMMLKIDYNMHEK